MQNAAGSTIERPAESRPRARRVCALALSGLLMACDATIGNTYGLIGDSTARFELDDLQLVASGRDRGDLVEPIAVRDGHALGQHGPAYFVPRILDALPPQELVELVGGRPNRIPRPDAIVILLGSADLLDPGAFGWTGFLGWSLMDTEAKRSAAIDVLLGAMPVGVPVLWVAPDPPALLPERRQAFRASLQEARARWPLLCVLETDPSWHVGTRADGIHFSLEGEDAAAREIVARLDALVGRKP